jgi:hypothetical protein
MTSLPECGTKGVLESRRSMTVADTCLHGTAGTDQSDNTGVDLPYETAFIIA